MDDRFVGWTHLLPQDASICPWNLPAQLTNLLKDKIDYSGNTWLGWKATTTDLPLLSQFQAVVLVKPRGISLSLLRAQGFTEVRSFVVVPNINEPRWFIPLQAKIVARLAWNLYEPFRSRARLYKRIAMLLTQMGAGAYLGDQIILARRAVSSLENVLARVVNTSEFSIAVSSGTPGPRRKLTIQLTTNDGSVLAYVKYGDRPTTGLLVQKEAQFLEHIHSLSLKAVIVPELLYHGQHNDGYIMVSAPLVKDAQVSKTFLTQRHIAVLLELAGCTGSKRTLDLLDQLKQRVKALQGIIDRTWYERLCLAIAAISSRPGIGSLPTALSHGDFAPWNIHVNQSTDRLFLFDWEHGQTDRFLLWDAFHFKTQVDILVRDAKRDMSASITLSDILGYTLAKHLKLSLAQVYALYAAYLVDTCTQWFQAHQMAKDLPAFEYLSQDMRGRILDNVVQSYLLGRGTLRDNNIGYSPTSDVDVGR